MKRASGFRLQASGLRTLAGAAIVAAHAIAFVVLVEHCHGEDLAVDVTADLAAQTATLEGHVPAGLASRIAHRDGPTVGLYRRRWSVTYRGGFRREVGATQLVGPFQDPEAPPCTGRVVVGQKLLDDGTGSKATVAGLLADEIDHELRGEDIFPVGAYRRIEHLSLRWSRLESHPEDTRLVGKAPDGYVRAAASVVFDRVTVPLVVALIPEHDGDVLRFRIAARANLDFGNRVFQWASDKLGADKIATRLARRQLEDVLVTTFAPPPPFELPDHQVLQFSYCASPAEIADNAYGALPFAVAISHASQAPQVLPPRLGTGSRPAPTADTTLALDLDPDALNALLYELWRTGWLDRQLAAAGLDRRFNTDPTVAEFLSVRISPPRLALPPVIMPGPGTTLQLAADARISLADGDTTTTGRVYGALRFAIAPSPAGGLPLSVDLGALELACERTATTLVPCYADLVSALRDRGSEFHGALTETFAKLLSDIFIDRELTAAGLPGRLVIRGATPAITAVGTLHLELAAELSTR
jgi:hypothetical protein